MRLNFSSLSSSETWTVALLPALPRDSNDVLNIEQASLRAITKHSLSATVSTSINSVLALALNTLIRL